MLSIVFNGSPPKESINVSPPLISLLVSSAPAKGPANVLPSGLRNPDAVAIPLALKDEVA